MGYEIVNPPPRDVRPGDVLILWNRYSRFESEARRYEEAGARVIVMENGYIGKDSRGWQFYAMALWEHGGAGDWPSGSIDRWNSFGIKVKPWQTEGEEIVVLPQRGLGRAGTAMPKNWPDDVVARLRRVTDRPVRIRPHPGKNRECPLYDLKNAWAAVTWASGAGIKAIVGGVPVFCEQPKWIGATASHIGIDNIENRFLGDREPMLARLAYAQWSTAEIEQGIPFRWLLG